MSQQDMDLLLWLHAEAVWLARYEDEDDGEVRTLPELIALLRTRHELDLLGAIWLYVDWRYVTRQLTTEQKTLWADAVDVFGDEADHGAKADRWWELLPCGHTRAEAERSIRHELCAVHPEANRG